VLYSGHEGSVTIEKDSPVWMKALNKEKQQTFKALIIPFILLTCATTRKRISKHDGNSTTLGTDGEKETML
jgi:hypothetical protein